MVNSEICTPHDCRNVLQFCAMPARGKCAQNGENRFVYSTADMWKEMENFRVLYWRLITRPINSQLVLRTE